MLTLAACGKIAIDTCIQVSDNSISCTKSMLTLAACRNQVRKTLTHARLPHIEFQGGQKTLLVSLPSEHLQKVAHCLGSHKLEYPLGLQLVRFRTMMAFLLQLTSDHFHLQSHHMQQCTV